jgi:GTP diphosphokinase / guanosine-3',5'-bis(diphosphate) 3'-diphosphatase
VVAPSPFGALIQRLRKPTENAIVVSGQTDILVDYARCCSPMKGEPIVGYITRGRGLSVHRSDCAMVKGLDADRFVAVTWDGNAKTQHQGLLRLTAEDRPGLLADISSLCANAHINLWRADVRAQGDRAICDLGISVNDVLHLAEITRKLKAVKGVISVERAG